MIDTDFSEFNCDTSTVRANQQSEKEIKKGGTKYDSYDYRYSAYSSLALWSNPAWINGDEKNSIQATAMSVWVNHHRTWTAVDRFTMAELIGTVKGMIPDSKLAEIGDYRYDLDVEEIYDVLEENDLDYANVDEETLTDGHREFKRCDHPKKGQRSNECDHFISTKESQNSEEEWVKILLCQLNHKSSSRLRHSLKGIDKWTMKWRELLKSIRDNLVQEEVLDPWSDNLLKISLRFFAASRSNLSLIQIMDTEIPFISDYKQIQEDPISIIELLSTPQPYLENNLDVNYEETDAIWDKLSSPSVRKLWDLNSTVSLIEKILPRSNAFLDTTAMSERVATNFLRMRRQKNCTKEISKDTPEVTEVKSKELLGSLIDFIDDPGLCCSVCERFSKRAASTCNVFFPEAHGEWTKTLFPYRSKVSDAAPDRMVCELNKKSVQHSLPQPRMYIPPHISFPPPLTIPPPSYLTWRPQLPAQKAPHFLPFCTKPLQGSVHYKNVRQPPPLHTYSNMYVSGTDKVTHQTLTANLPLPLKQSSYHTVPVSKIYDQSQIVRTYQVESQTVTEACKALSSNLHQKLMSINTTQYRQLPDTGNVSNVVSYQTEQFSSEMKNYEIFQSSSKVIQIRSNLLSQASQLRPRIGEQVLQPLISSLRSKSKSSLGSKNILSKYKIPSKISALRSIPMQSSNQKRLEEEHHPYFSFQTEYEVRKILPIALKFRNNLPTALVESQSGIIQHDKSPQRSTGIKYKGAIARKIASRSVQMHEAANNHMEKCLQKFSIHSEKLQQKNVSILHGNKRKKTRPKIKNKTYTGNRNAGIGYAVDVNGCLRQNRMSDKPNMIGHDKKMKRLIIKLKKRHLQEKKGKLSKLKIFVSSSNILLKDNNMHCKYLAHKWIWDCYKLHKKLRCISIEDFLIDSIKASYGDKCEILETANDKWSEKDGSREMDFHSFRVGDNEPSMNDTLFKIKTPLTNHQQTNPNQQNSNPEFTCPSWSSNAEEKRSWPSAETKRFAIAKYLNKIADNLLISGIIKTDGSNSVKSSSEKVNGWTHFQTAIQRLLRNASQRLLLEGGNPVPSAAIPSSEIFNT